MCGLSLSQCNYLCWQNKCIVKIDILLMEVSYLLVSILALQAIFKVIYENTLFKSKICRAEFLFTSIFWQYLPHVICYEAFQKWLWRQSVHADSLTTEESVLSFQIELSTETKWDGGGNGFIFTLLAMWVVFFFAVQCHKNCHMVKFHLQDNM